MEILSLKTGEKEQAIDITSIIHKIISKSSLQSGVCLVFCPHTTAAIAINEGSDETLAADLFAKLGKLFPESDAYAHESNSPAHLKSVFVGSSKSIPITTGKLALGTWQSVLLLEFDGPQERQVYVQIYGR